MASASLVGAGDSPGPLVRCQPRELSTPFSEALLADSIRPPPQGDDLHNAEDPVEKTTAWAKILEHLKSRVDERDFETWFRDSRQRSETSEAIIVHVRAPLYVNYIPEAFGSQIAEAARQAGYGNREIRFVADGDYGAAAEPLRVPAEPRRRPGALNTAYTFEKFVTGASNRLAHAAAQRVADQTSRQYNPLFICGGTGLGKTHLMQAIGHRRLSRRPGERVIYMTSESFVNDVVQGVRFNRMETLRQRLRAADILLLDDVQFVVGKEASENELFHTFNALYDEGTQIVFSSDVPPREIPGLTERLKSRFEGGLIVDIQPPDFETKVAILRQKADVHNLRLDDDVAFFLAGKIKSSIRELEGYFNRVVAFASLRGEPVSLEVAREALRDVFRGDERSASPPEIIRAVATHYGLKPADLRARTKRGSIVFPRQVAMYILKEVTDLSLPEIGRLFSDKHHTTALHAIRKIAALRDEDPDLDRLLSGFIAQFH
jgi:chromosomal replication initiator protein